MSMTSNLFKVINNTSCLSIKNNNILNLITRNCANVFGGSFLQYDKDPGPQFINPEIQSLLKSMTRIHLDKIYRKRSVADNTIEYKFMTTEQLEKKFQEATKKAEQHLQMPPIVMIKQDEHKIISKDPGLDCFSRAKFVITDITYGLKQSNRKVVIRHTDGTLEHAPQVIRKRVNQLYFPLPGRNIRTPRMFEPEYLEKCLDDQKYEFILDRVCVQYEPNEKEFHEISCKVYTHLNETKKFDDLRSTRHFGPMVFFYAWHKIIDDLLYDMIKRDYLRNGLELIVLTYKLNNINFDKSIVDKLSAIPESSKLFESPGVKGNSNDVHEQIRSAIGKSGDDFKVDELCFGFIEAYIKGHALKKAPLELALQTYKETNDEKKKLYEGLLKAHGVN